MSKFTHDERTAALRQKMSTRNKPWFHSCSNVLEKKGLRNLKCLDLCCGNGEFSEILRENFGMSVTCADYIPLHLEHVKQLGFEAFQIDLETDEGSARTLSGKYAEKFDLVVNLAAIEHVFNTENLLRFVHSVLKPGGIFLVNTPNISYAGYALSSILSGNRPFGEGHHVRFWNYRFLRTNLFLHGFNDFEDHRGFFSLPYDPLLRAFRNRSLPARVLTQAFQVCRIFQHIPFLRNICTDELTILCRKEDVPLVGFEIESVRANLAACQEPATRRRMIERLLEAQTQGWLDEHLYLSRFVTEMAEKYQTATG